MKYENDPNEQNWLVGISAALKKDPKPSLPSLRWDLVPLGFVVFLFQAMATQKMNENPNEQIPTRIQGWWLVGISTWWG